MKRAYVPRTAELLGLLFALALVAILGFLSYRAWAALDRHNEQLVVTRQILRGTNALLGSLTEAETGQRGFLLTGRERYLNPYREALVKIPIALDALELATATRPDQIRRVATLKPLLTQKLEEMQQTLEVYQNRGPEAAVAMVQGDRGMHLMDQIREACSEIQTVSYSRLAEQSENAQSSANWMGLVSTLGSAALLGLLVLATSAIHKGTRRRQRLIEELQESEEQTREARDWLQTTLASIGDAVIATDAKGRVTFLNAVAEALTGWTQEQAAGLPLEQMFVINNEETGAPVESPVSKALREGRIVGLANHTRLTAKDGRQIPIDDSAAPIRDAQGNIAGVVLVFRDISQRRETERRDMESAAALARLAAIVESSDDAIISKDPQGIVTSWNRAAERMFGYTSEEMVGRPIMILSSVERPDEIAAILKRVMSGDHIEHHETTRRTKSGREISVSLTVSPIRDRQGKIVGASKIARDISARVAIEAEQARQAALLARTNAELEHFAYAASHDLREPLRTITAYAQLLKRLNGSHLDAQSIECLQFIVDGSHRMTQLIDALLAYSKAGETGERTLGPVRSEQVLTRALDSLRSAIQENDAVVTHDALPTVLGEEIAVEQLFQNLIGNALKYRREEAPRVHVSAKQQGDEWVFAVSDNGQGIAPQFQSQVFELFKRLHGRDYPGTGIGLATCKKIVERHGGRIWLESEAGCGSTFFFTLPAPQDIPPLFRDETVTNQS